MKSDAAGTIPPPFFLGLKRQAHTSANAIGRAFSPCGMLSLSPSPGVLPQSGMGRAFGPFGFGSNDIHPPLRLHRSGSSIASCPAALCNHSQPLRNPSPASPQPLATTPFAAPSPADDRLRLPPGPFGVFPLNHPQSGFSIPPPCVIITLGESALKSQIP